MAAGRRLCIDGIQNVHAYMNDGRIVNRWQVSCSLADHPRWSFWWDKKHGLWRVAEDDPDSALYAESSDTDTVMRYITAHARESA
jgi:hypothetical protein